MQLFVYTSIFLRCLVTADPGGIWTTPPGNTVATVPNSIYHIGETLPLSFSTTLSTYTISLVQNRLDTNGFSVFVLAIQDLNGNAAPITAANWTVQSYHFDLGFTTEFYFDLSDRAIFGGNYSMTSHYFNIEPAVASTSISTNPNNTTSTTGATSTAPTCPTATGMKLGLGLGLGLGIPFLAALGSLIYLVLRRQASAIGMVQSFSDVAKSEYPVENYYRNTSELYEASGEPEIYQAPGSSAIFEAPESNK